MFVNYMPFLLLGFMAIEDYFEGKRKHMVTLWAFLMLMTSYFFAVSGLAGNWHLHQYYNFAGWAVETVPRSLRHSCGSELT